MGSNHDGDPLGAISDLRGDLLDIISTPRGWGPGGGDQSRWGPPRVHFGHETCDQNFDAREVGTNHSGDPAKGHFGP